ncbi:MAG: NHL repeat-containing protein [Actinomycetota bacterium]|nr:NHL repeat-containing protein [Actinomycetota bacterium]
MLPDASPRLDSLYAPRGVWTDGKRMVVADTGNHRLLIWHTMPAQDHLPADLVVGQPHAFSEGANRVPGWLGLNLPTGIAVVAGRLVVADAWNHRVLVFERIPEDPGEGPLYAIGQDGLLAAETNAGGPCGPTTLNWPFGVAQAGGRFWIADTGNRRVLGWSRLPEPGDIPELVVGQPDFVSNRENRGGLGPASFRWVHDVAEAEGHLYFADAGNHRVLVWPAGIDGDCPALGALGQSDLESADEWAYGPQGPSVMRFPYGVTAGAGRVAVADTANNRVLVFVGAPATSGTAADAVLGQDNFDEFGENRWKELTRDSLCWPYGLCMAGDVLAVADSGNNRVVLWSFDGDAAGSGDQRAPILARAPVDLI